MVCCGVDSELLSVSGTRVDMTHEGYPDACLETFAVQCSRYFKL